ncbi:MAG: carboxypeptidase regulatory-like domain-containing protein [Acidobacteria bacterium]|nr:carboxypeptidase regulatory-like domain-containing protein [Acidobacteriota bacterium]
MRKEKTGSKAGKVLLSVAGSLFLTFPFVQQAQVSQPSAGTNPASTERSQKKPAKPSKSKPGPAIISGTVFRDPGLSFPGVEVTLEPQPEGKASNKPGKKMRTISDSRGEFSFRVPGVPMRYTVSVQATGYQPEKSQVFINGEERQDVFYTLKPVPNPATNARE